MKCISNVLKRISICALSGLILLLAGCGAPKYEMPFTLNPESSSYRMIDREERSIIATPFAFNLCVVNSNINPTGNVMQASGAALFDINNKNTIYAKNVHDKLYPASLTKIMTALVALKYGSGDMLLTASANVESLEADAQVCGLKAGDQMTLTQALHLLLINSANDAAILIAEGLAGSIDAFSDMMNDEALLLGATNTHFVNPHGLSDDNHFTTVYDMYLITNEAIKYELFNEIVHMSTYTTVYTTRNGNPKELTVNSTNQYLMGAAQAPGEVSVIGGKTGTTNAAGHCLILHSRDASGNPYISVIMRSDSRDNLYAEMTELLKEINN